MIPFDEFQSDLEVLRHEGMLVIFLLLGAACFVYAIVLLAIAQPPNSFGALFFTLGITLWFYVLTRMSSIRSLMTMNKINQRLENIEQMVKK